MKKLFVAIATLLLVIMLFGCSAEPAALSPAPELDLAVYSIYYHPEGGELSPYNPVAYNSLTPTVTLKEPTRAGYKFVGWSTSESGAAPYVTQLEKGTTGNIDLYAVWAQLYSIRVDAIPPEFFTVTYVTGPVLYGETATVRIATAEPVSSLQWYCIGDPAFKPESCVYDEATGAFVAEFLLTKNINVTVEAVL